MSSNFPFDVKDKSRVLQDSHPPNRTPSHEFTYAQATSGQNSNQSSSSAAPDINNLMSSFLQAFKSLINPLITLLTKVISCVLDKKKNDLQHFHKQITLNSSFQRIWIKKSHK